MSGASVPPLPPNKQTNKQISHQHPLSLNNQVIFEADSDRKAEGRGPGDFTFDLVEPRAATAKCSLSQKPSKTNTQAKRVSVN